MLNEQNFFLGIALGELFSFNTYVNLNVVMEADIVSD